MTIADQWRKRSGLLLGISSVLLAGCIVMLLLGSRSPSAWFNLVTWSCIFASLFLLRRAERQRRSTASGAAKLGGETSINGERS